MDGDTRIERTIGAISARDGRAADHYHALSDDARKAVLERLSSNGLRALTRLIKSGRKKRFAAGEERFLTIAAGSMETPVYLLDETLIEENMRIMRYVKDRTGCKVLHALKSYATFATFSMMSRYLDGTCASGLNEARLGYEEFKKEVHTFGAAYRENEIEADPQVFRLHHIQFVLSTSEIRGNSSKKRHGNRLEGQSGACRGRDRDIQPLRTVFEARNHLRCLPRGIPEA